MTGQKMLSDKQEYKLVIMWGHYCIGMKATHNVDTETISKWGERYKIAMSRVLQRQGKRLYARRHSLKQSIPVQPCLG